MLLLLLPVVVAAGRRAGPKGRQRLQPLAAEDKAGYTLLANENADICCMSHGFKAVLYIMFAL